MARILLISLLGLLLLSSAVAALVMPVRTLTYVEVTVDPEEPDDNDEVTISVEYLIDVPEEHIWIFIDDENVEECEGKTCSYEGGLMRMTSRII